jgi:[ribosomal protein S5]-alanine N-acetyltransferase
MIKTTRLYLLPVESIHKEAFSHDKLELAKLLQVTLPNNWPQFPEAFSLPDDSREASPLSTDWPGYFFIHPKEEVLVGNGSFTGSPDALGIVEIGYEIAPQHWNRGFAKEAAGALVDYAFAHEKVHAVIAHTLAEKNASNSVLRKVGMKFVEEMANPEVGKVWRWQINRNDYHDLST